MSNKIFNDKSGMLYLRSSPTQDIPGAEGALGNTDAMKLKEAIMNKKQKQKLWMSFLPYVFVEQPIVINF